MSLLLSIDQGTTSTRCIVFDDGGHALGTGQQELAQSFPRPGWVEHDAEEIWDATLATARTALDAAGVTAADLAALGITNQRETVVLWERDTGRPLHAAIVWQDRRTSDECARLRRDGHEVYVRSRTGLLLDPYFSATKIAWLLDHVPDARVRAARGELAVGTIDTFLLWRLTGGAVHATDATNASRTLLFDIHEQRWDDELLARFHVPAEVLPEVLDCTADFGQTRAELLGAAVPVTGIAGDQQAAAVGQACWESGLLKSTYGTGCFALLNTGDVPPSSTHRLLTTVAFRLDGKTSYALEGSIFSAGSAIQWLRDGLGLIRDAAESEALARASDPDRPVFLVPAFTGLGAPHWDPDARGAIVGLTRDATAADVVRAGLESVAYQTADLLEAMVADDACELSAIRVDGGMVANDWLMQRLADLLGLPVERPELAETTALGAAYLAGLQAGVFRSPSELADHWRLDRRFEPAMGADQRAERLAGWRAAVARVRSD